MDFASGEEFFGIWTREIPRGNANKRAFREHLIVKATGRAPGCRPAS